MRTGKNLRLCLAHWKILCRERLCWIFSMLMSLWVEKIEISGVGKWGWRNQWGSHSSRCGTMVAWPN